MRRPLSGLTGIAAMLGWLQLAPAFGFPVTAPAGMLDRVFGAGREAGPLGWALLFVGLAFFVAVYFVVVEPRAHPLFGATVFTVGAWLLAGAVVMPLLGLLQGGPGTATVPPDPMRANFFMLSLGIGAASQALVGWALLGCVLVAGASMNVSPRSLALAVVAAALAGTVALAAPGLALRADADRVVEGPLPALPDASVFISVLELPQPAGAALLPHPPHIPGFVLSTLGTATMVMSGKVVDVGQGDAVFLPDHVVHDHENRAAVPLAIVLAVLIIGLTVAMMLGRGRRRAVALMVALLVAGTVATANPLMNHWYFIGVRPAATHGAPMPAVPAAHRSFESEDLVGLGSGPFVERLTDRRLGAGESARFTGPAAIFVLDGQISVVTVTGATDLSAQRGVTVSGGTEATIKTGSGSARVLVVQVLPAS